MKKKLLAIISGAFSFVSLVVIYDRFFNKAKWENKLFNLETIGFSVKKITHRDYHSHERFLRENPLAILLLVVLATVLIFNGGLQEYMRFFQTSVIQTRYTTESFDGAVYPVDKVPKWTELTTAERSYSYSQIPAKKFMSLPSYNLADFRKGMTWNAINERERNAYITYPVPYMGNYQLDGTENTGSHTGVDIKIPTGTPIRSISRGVVIKAKNETTGFGKHIVIMHTNVPDPQNYAKKTTLFSAYAHLSQIKVKVGQQVQKGQIIGLSGSTGMSTAPHIHFQIDRADAPFHPYWPITWKDVTAHGLSSFFEAVRRGVNKAKGRQYTVNPMKLISRTISYTPPTTTTSRLVASAGISDAEISRDSRSASSSVSKNTTTRRTTRIVRRNNSRTSFKFKREPAPRSNNRIRIASRRPTVGTNTLHASAEKTKLTQKTAATTTVNKPEVVTEKSATTPRGTEKTTNSSSRTNTTEKIWFEADRVFVPGVIKTVKLHINDKSLIPNGGVTISTNSRDFIKISPILARAEAFRDGYLEVKIIANSEKPFKIIANAKGVSAETTTFLAQPFTDISAWNKDRTAAKYVKDNNIMKGYNGEFKPNNFLNRAEAAKIIVTANKLKLNPAKKDFQDVDRNAWFAKYVSTVANLGIVSGYQGNLFKPSKEVTVAEFLKMALVAKGVDPAVTNASPYKDVSASAWYEKYFTYARNNGLLKADSRGQVHPNKKISRMETAYLLYKLSQL